MLTVPALKVQQFSQEFFLLNLVAADVERLVRFEVLADTPVKPARPGRPARVSVVNWAELEKRVERSDQAYQRPIMRRKVEELARYYLQCREDGSMFAIPGAVLLTTDEPVRFVSQNGNPYLGLLELPDEEGSLHVLDGQHRLLALTALLHGREVSELERGAARLLQVPAVLFAGLPGPVVVEMFVTINSKHTRLNPSLLFSLNGRKLYSDRLDARIHDVIRKLNETEGSPLQHQIKMLGVGAGKVAQAGLAQELRRVLVAIENQHSRAPWFAGWWEHLERFYLAYFKEVADVFAEAWNSKRHSIQSLIALRALIQVSEVVIVRVMEAGGDPRATLRRLLAPWRQSPGSRRFETAGEWRSKLLGGGKDTTRALARELMSSLEGGSG